MNQKYPTITIRLNQEVKTQIERQANREDVSVSELLRRYIDAGLHNV